MGSIFRSEEMTLCQIIMPPDAAYFCVSELGEIGVFHFRDLNVETNAFQKKYISEVCRCDEMERKLRFIEKEITKNDIAINTSNPIPEALKQTEMLELEGTLEKLQEELIEVNANAGSLTKNHSELVELKYILQNTQQYFTEGKIDATVQIQSQTGGSSHPVNIGYITGLIPRIKMPSFERLIWRTCRGNVLIRQHEVDELVEDPVSGEKINKVVFVIFFQGDQLKSRIQKICEGFRANVYPCPNTSKERQELAVGVLARIEDIVLVLNTTKEHRTHLLVGAAQDLRTWQIRVQKTKSIFHTMNMFNTDVAKQSLLAECWAPVNELDRIQLALRRGTELSGTNIPPICNRLSAKTDPPTFFKSNKLTKPFHSIVDSYGIATYQEMSPTPFTVISFPFLFAVMFGDFGHGLIMFLFALWMCVFEKSLNQKWKDNEMWRMLFDGRYIVLLMGIFSVYTGLIYNDVFGLAMNIFGSSWRANYDFHYLSTVQSVQLEPDANNRGNRTDFVQMYSGSPYPFGVDPIWALAQNKINFLNSLKMKFSLIAGVLQMLFGLILSLTNILYFNRMEDVYFDFIPQIVFFVALFFYLIVLIFAKWTHYDGSSLTCCGAACAPNLLVQYINMFLFSYGDQTCSLAPIYKGQKYFQTFLVVIAVLCVPLMLIPKPYLEYRKRKPSKRSALTSESSTDLIETTEVSIDENSQIDMGEVIVRRSIDTIEFFLSSVSSTASYLRLWALSLAHSQLSEVLWTMLMEMGFTNSMVTTGIVSFLIFFAWSVLTVGILLVMEGLSAFLHALRLHWVEFESKFFKGEGYPFAPFSFRRILEENGLI